MKQRIITAIIGIIVVLPIILYGSWPFKLAIYLLATVALYEFIRMFKLTNYFYLIISTVFLWAFIYLQQNDPNDFFQMDVMSLVILYMVILLLCIVFSKNKFSYNDASRFMLALLFIGFSFYYMIEVRSIGLNVFLFILFVIWATDSGAYFIGKRFGKRKLWPEISPNKTIGGAVGGIIFAFLLAVIFQLIYPFDKSVLSIGLIAIVISIFGQLGDLVASAMKRKYNVKDFGHIFPGHGGVLDRLDSFIFVLLVLQMIQYF